jgi:hypothetical protein
MIEIVETRPLVFDDGSFLPAASGIASRRGDDWVICDERPLVARIPAGGPLEPVSLSDERLPEDPLERKAVKPDLEAIALMPEGDLLVLGSGSTERRERGWLLPATGGPPWEISLAALYAELRRELADLNIEGAACLGGVLWLAQRGNGADGLNALVETSYAGGDLFQLRGVRPVGLPHVDGVPLTLTDLSPGPDGTLFFTAVAEDVASTYLDGPCVGAAVGIVDPARGEVERLEMLTEPLKVEGISQPPDRPGELSLVVDPDDPTRPGLLVRARW